MKSNIFHYLDYRDFIREEIKHRKKSQFGASFALVAKKTNIGGPYFSKVMNKYAEFNSDQLYAVFEVLGVHGEERKFGFLLLEYTRCANPKRKKELAAEVQSIQAQKSETKEQINTSELSNKDDAYFRYYLEPMHLIVHMALGLKTTNNRIGGLEDKMNISREQLRKYIKTLESLDLISVDHEKITPKVGNLHLSKRSPLCRAHQRALKELARDYRSRRINDEDYELAITYTADDKARKKIQTLFFEFLKQADKIISKAPAEKIYQLNFDLFEWI